MVSARPIRIAYVDGLRAIAVLLVVFVHATHYDPAVIANPDAFPVTLLQYGNHGVQLFFVLSGFCLSYPTLVRLHDSGTVNFDVVRFVSHRLVRIVPPYYAAIVVLVAVNYALGRVHFGFPSPPFGPDLVHHFSLVRQLLFLDDKDWLNPSFWTLPIEFRWYALFPIMLLVWVRSPRAIFTIAAVASILVFSAADSDDVQALPAFLLGIVAADARIRTPLLSRYAVVAFPIAVTLSVLGERFGHWDGRYNSWWVASVFLLVVAAGAASWLERALSMWPLRAIGLTSYGIYLVHEPFVALVDAHVRIAHVSSWIVASGVGLCVGIVFSLVCEQPFVGTSASRRMIARISAVAPNVLAFVGVPSSFQLCSRHDRAGELVSSGVERGSRVATSAAENVKASNV